MEYTISNIVSSNSLGTSSTEYAVLGNIPVPFSSDHTLINFSLPRHSTTILSASFSFVRCSVASAVSATLFAAHCATPAR